MALKTLQAKFPQNEALKIFTLLNLEKHSKNRIILMELLSEKAF
jgi:hypothetical protein